MSDAEFPQSSDEALERFEKAWASGNSPDIEKFLLNSVSLQDQWSLLADLIDMDLEYRWKRFSDTLSTDGEDEQPLCPSLVDYVSRFAGLSDDEAMAERLLIHEYRVRQRWGDGVDLTSLLLQNSDCISDALVQRLKHQFLVETDAATPETNPSRKPSVQIGPYKLLQKIAEGGMGAVYMAEQKEPIRRRVAVKVIKVGANSDQIIARFEAERQALAMMEHPNIARIFDGGSTDEGWPYFVMELVKGIPLTEYCDNNRLSIRERLELFVPVCKAVQHAHLKGIIHRDLKPSNVLVALNDGIPVPKVIDFGLAKATEHQTKLTDKTMFTEFGQVVGTLQYMSPEQAEMNQLDVDTRTDVYSLGVMLYELLTGSTPLDRATLGENALLAVLAMIRNQEPPRPSARLSESGDAITGVSEQRRIEPFRLQQILRGELDWIVMRSLEKDRRRRYETANVFAEDLTRHLNDEQVLARPPSLGYRLQKIFRRHRVSILTGISVVLLLVAGLIGTGSMWLKANRLAQEKQGVAEKAQTAEAQERTARQEVERERDNVEQQRQNVVKARQETEAALAQANYLLAQARWNDHRATDAIEFLEKIPAQNRRLEWYLARRKFRGSDFICYGHTDTVADVDCNSDGSEIVSAGSDGTVRIWDAVTGEQQELLVRQPSAQWTSVQYSRDDSLITAGSATGTIHLWNADSGKELRTMKVNGAVTDVNFSPDNRLIAASCRSSPVKTGVLSPTAGNVHVWRVDNGEPAGKPMADEHDVTSIAFSPDSSLIVAGDNDGNLKSWNVESGQPEITESFDEEVAGICFSPDGDQLLAGFKDASGFGLDDGKARMLDVSTGKLLKDFVILWDATSVAFSPDGSLIATGHSDSCVRIWIPRTGRLLKTLVGHRQDVTALKFTPDGARLVSASVDKTIRMWRILGEGKAVIEIESDSEVFSDDGLLLSTSEQDFLFPTGTVSIWNLRTGSRTPIKSWMKPRCVAFSHDGQQIAVAVKGKTMLFNVSTGDVLTKMDTKPFGANWVEFSQHDRVLYSAGDDGKVRIWDVEDGECLQILELQLDTIDIMKLNCDGTRLLTADSSGKLRVWDPESSEVILAIDGKGEAETTILAAASFSPDGHHVAVCVNTTLQVWDLESGADVWRTVADQSLLTSVVYTQDGARIVTGGIGGTVRIWDAETGEEIAAFPSSWEPDKEMYPGNVKVCREGILVVWSERKWGLGTETKQVTILGSPPRQETTTLRGHVGDVKAFQFHVENALLRTQSEQKTLIWDVSTDSPVQVSSSVTSGWTRHTSSDGRWLAIPDGNKVRLVDQTFKKHPAERAFCRFRAKHDAGWHVDRAEQAEVEEDWYAATFHRAWQVRITPESRTAIRRLRDDYGKLNPKTKEVLPAVITESIKTAQSK
ncbi:MAG: protein kinase [Fuerstiella sp.]|nr:protein kinase [Fuerstiella sp.]